MSIREMATHMRRLRIKEAVVKRWIPLLLSSVLVLYGINRSQRSLVDLSLFSNFEHPQILSARYHEVPYDLDRGGSGRRERVDRGRSKVRNVERVVDR
jgi:hypothetical protein